MKRKKPQPDSGDLDLRRETLILLLAFVLPNLGALWCSFVLDDMPIIASNPMLHSLGHIREIWTSPYWPNRISLTLYRPLTKTIWAILWTAGGGRAFFFHLTNLIAGGLVVVLFHRLLRLLVVEKRVAFVASFLFALFPIHTEATTSIVGFSELLAAALGIGALLAFRHGRRALAIALFALAIVSKESSAMLPAVAWMIAPRPKRRFIGDGVVAAAIVGAAILARSAVAQGPQTIAAVDNPMEPLSAFLRVLTALWIQCLYVWKTIVPLTLSADYSYKQIPLVMGLHDPRAWAGAGLAALSIAIVIRKRTPLAAGIAIWWIFFLPASNLLFPVGTVMGERLAYLPSAGLALAIAILIERFLRDKPRSRLFAIMTALAILYGTRTAVRNVDWLGPDRFYPKLVETSPDSAKTWFFHGAWRAWEGDDEGAVASYDRSIAILPFYTEPIFNRANALARLGRFTEAREGYRDVLRYDPENKSAAITLSMIVRGARPNPPRPKL